jgi:hypothetical protein
MIYYPSLCCDFVLREDSKKGVDSEMPEHSFLADVSIVEWNDILCTGDLDGMDSS